jgi:uncharacterized protein YbaA (DUF1428 family)
MGQRRRDQADQGRRDAESGGLLGLRDTLPLFAAAKSSCVVSARCSRIRLVRAGVRPAENARQERWQMPYIDGFIIAVPKKNIDTYRKISRKCGKIWREFGALDYREAVADDVDVGKVTSFPRAVKMKPDETVIFAYILYKSRRDRDRINARVMKDPRLAKMMTPGSMPFDGKRMIVGGFKTIVDA